jgi:Na+-driven multidrug efflux pump
MIFLLISGVLNVGLNFLFVSGLGMSVEGVAYATVISQAFSAACCLIVVLKSKGYSKFSFKYFKIYKRELIEIMKVGVPGGIQGCLFALSSVFLASAVNALDIVNPGTLAANTAATQFDNVVYFIGNSVAVSCMSFVGQNYGAGDIDRVKKVIKISILATMVGTLSVGLIIVLCSRFLLGIMTDDATVIAIGQIRLGIMGLTYFLCEIMEVLSLSMRALGKATISMVICLIGSCLFRIIWINTIYHLNETYFMICLCYPITWILTVGALIGFLIPQIKKIERRLNAVKSEKDEQL